MGVGVTVTRLRPCHLLQRPYPRVKRFDLGFKGLRSTIREAVRAASRNDRRWQS